MIQIAIVSSCMLSCLQACAAESITPALPSTESFQESPAVVAKIRSHGERNAVILAKFKVDPADVVANGLLPYLHFPTHLLQRRRATEGSSAISP